jgi:hypothetical protein
MTTAMITQRGTIRSSHSVREDFSGQSTGNIGMSGRTGYYETKGHAVNAFDGVLQGYDLCLDRDDLSDFHGDEGRKTIDVYDECGNCVGRAILMWYRMDQSGRYEFIGYLA